VPETVRRRLCQFDTDLEIAIVVGGDGLLLRIEASAQGRLCQSPAQKPAREIDDAAAQ
jgi:hypothetical protein